MKKQLRYFLVITFAITSFSCSKEDGEILQEPVKSAAKQITGFAFRAEDNDALTETITATVNESNKAITATVPYSTDITDFTPLIQVSDKASVSPTATQDFTNPVTYTVTAEDGTKATYNTTVTVTPNDAKQILSFVFRAEDNADLNEKIQATINEETKLINATVPYGTNITELIPFINISEAASITPTGIQDFTSVVKYEVSAEDASVVTYDIKINVKPNSEKQILSFGFSFTENPISVNIIGVIDEDTKTITFDVPYGTVVSALLPNLTISNGATVSPEGLQDFSNPVEYVVTAEDGSTETYKATRVVSQRNILLAILSANPRNTIDWDLNDQDISHWEGVTLDANNNIIELRLSNKSIDKLPFAISQLKNLQNLTLVSNDIVTIPESISELQDLRILNLRDNKLNFLPKEIGSLTNLRSLILEKNGFHALSLPREISQLTNLRNLDLSHNNFSSIPDFIFDMTSLLDLDFNTNHFLTTIPPEINQLTNLIRLNLARTNLSSLPTEFGQLTNLTDLSLYDNNFTYIPQSILSLNQLTTLDFRSNALTYIPLGIEQLSNLTSLSLSVNQISYIPFEMGQMINLSFLNLQFNELNDIPIEIGQLVNLTSLILSGNNLTTLPQAVCNLENTGTNVQVDDGVICQ